MIEARHLRVLQAVSRAGSFSAAARELGCTQPAVSQQVKALEQAVRTPLVVRVGRETRLTEAGASLTRRAAGILAGLSAAEEEVAAIVGLRSGRVRILSFPSATAAFVPAALARMRADHPGTLVTVEDVEPPRSIEMLRSGECDVALAFRWRDHQSPPAGGDWDDLVVRPLTTERMIGLVPEGHRLAVDRASAAAPAGPPDGVGSGSRRSVGISELAEEPWIVGSRYRRHLLDACSGEGFIPRVDFTVADWAAGVGLVAAGCGVALLPESALGSVRRPGLTVLDIRPAIEREAVAVTLPDLAGVPAVDEMLARLVSAAAGVEGAERGDQIDGRGRE